MEHHSRPETPHRFRRMVHEEVPVKVGMAEAQGVLLERNGWTGRPVTEDVPVTSMLGFHHGEVLVDGADQQLMNATRGLRDYFRSVTQVTVREITKGKGM